jgi:predicted MFS family arabinose efflux permease
MPAPDDLTEARDRRRPDHSVFGVTGHGAELSAVAGRAAPIRLLQVTAFVSTFDRFAMPPMLIAISADLDTSLSSVVQAAGAYFLAYGLMQPVWGMVSDSIGLVRTMRLALLCAGLASLAGAFAWSALALGIARGIAGGFYGAAYPASLIYLGDTVPADRRQRDVARLMVGVALGTGLSFVGAGLVAQLWSWRAAFVITGAAALVLALVLRRLAEPPRTRVHRTVLTPLLAVARSRTTVLVLGLAFVEGAVLLGALTLLPAAVAATGASTAVAGAVTAVYGLSVFIASGLVGRLSRRLHPSWLIGIGAGSAVTACAVLAVARTPAVALGVTALLGLAWTAMHSSLQTWATEVLPPARATVVSLFAGSLFIGSALAAVVVADLADAGRYRLIFVLAGIAAVPLGLVAVWGRARWRRPA